MNSSPASETLALAYASMKPISQPQIYAVLARALGMPSEHLRSAFRIATPEDIPEILRLRRDTLGPAITWDDEKYWRWKYLEQPELHNGEIPCWVFEKDDEIIAAMGFERIQLCANGKIYPGVWSYDIMVRPDYDGRGLGVLMNHVFQRHFPLLMVLGTNDRSTGMLERLFTPLPPLRFWKKLIRAQPTLERRLRWKSLAPPLATMADSFLAAYNYSTRIRVPPDLEIRRLDAFDEGVNLLCDRTQSQKTVLVRRHKDYLNWRYVSHPRHTYFCYGAFRADRLQGYIVTHLAATEHQTLGVISDWLAESDDSVIRCSVMRLLLQHAIHELTRAGADVLHAFAYQSSIEQILRTLWFTRDPSGDIPFFLGASPQELQPYLLANDNWILTKGDSDIG